MSDVTGDVHEVAREIVRAGHRLGLAVDPLKLQKLLYYVQGWHLAEFGAPIFNDQLKAWDYGPVVRAVYDIHAGTKDPLPLPAGEPNLSELKLALIERVVRKFAVHTSGELVDMTHEEPPWVTARDQGRNATIEHESLRAYFGAQPGVVGTVVPVPPDLIDSPSFTSTPPKNWATEMARLG